MIFKPLRKKTAAFLTKHMWVLFLLSNIKKLYCKNIFAIILFVISWNNIPAVFAGNSPKICIKNGSDRHITFRRQYDCLYSIYMPILIDKGEEQYVEVNDISEIYSMSALGYSKTCKVRFTRIIKEGECCIEVKISKWFADLGQKGYELLPGNSEPITIDENILSQFLSEENPTIYAKIPDARFDFFRTPISKEVIEEYIKEQCLPSLPYNLPVRNVERGHYTFADFAEMIDTFFIEPNLTESSFLKNHFPEFCSVGMFHIKGYDSVSCSYCGRRLYKWQEDDNPYKEHDRHFEECASGHAALFYVLRDFIFKSENVTEATISADCIKNLLLQSAQDQKTIKIIQLISDLDNLYLLSNCETAAVRQANETLRQNLFEVMRSYLCLLKIELNDKTFEFDKYLEKIDSMPERAATKMGTEDLQELEEIIKKIMHKVERTKNHLADTNKKILGMQTEAYPCFVNESEFYGGYNLAKEKYYALHEVFENYRQAFKERYQGVRNFDMTTEMLRNKYLTELLRFYIISEILPKIDVISESTKEAVETANLAPKKDKLYSLCLDKDFCVLRTLFGYTSESCKLFPRLTDRIRAAVSG